MSELLGIKEPRIGVLNVGLENTVGDRSTVEAHRLLSESGYNFAGFVEGRDLPEGIADVVVTNGFVGNILLKYTEGLPGLLGKVIPKEYSEVQKIIKEQFDYQSYGGEPLLGVKGVSIICHGASSAVAISASIRQAARMAKLQIHRKLEIFLTQKFDSYFSQVKYLRSFRRSFRLPDRFRISERGETNDNRK